MPPSAVPPQPSAPEPRLVLLHGFTQSAASWREVRTHLPGAEVLALDLPGHGGAYEAPSDLVSGASWLAARGGRGTWVGYSMGGRFALHVALHHAPLVERLVLIGAHPGLHRSDERVARQRADELLAARLEALGVPAFLDEWLSQPLFAGLDARARDLESRVVNRSEGLAGVLRAAGSGRQVPLWNRLRDLAMPVLYLVGERDSKYRAIGEELVESMGARATLGLVEGAGHAAPFENPGGFARALERWLADTPLLDPDARDR